MWAFFALFQAPFTQAPKSSCPLSSEVTLKPPLHVASLWSRRGSNALLFSHFLLHCLPHQIRIHRFFNRQSSEGFFKTGIRPQGFPPECLLCEVEVGNNEYNDVPKEWVYEQKYREYYGHFRQVLSACKRCIVHLYWCVGDGVRETFFIALEMYYYHPS